jgi:hypothetical protein
LKNNFGDILEKLGVKRLKKSRKSQDVLWDPHVLYKRIQIANYFIIPLLKYIDNYIK